MLSLKDSCTKAILRNNIDYSILPRDLVTYIHECGCYCNYNDVYYECQVGHVSCLIRLSHVWDNDKNLMIKLIEVSRQHNNNTCVSLLLHEYLATNNQHITDVIFRDQLSELKELLNQGGIYRLALRATMYAANLGRLSILSYLVEDLAVIYPSFVREVIINDHADCLRYLLKMKVYCVFDDVVSYAIRIAKDNNSTKCLSILVNL